MADVDEWAQHDNKLKQATNNDTAAGLSAIGLLASPLFSVNPVAVAVNVPLTIWNGLPIARRAYGVWSRERRLNVDFLDTVAITASLVQGL